jgi:hypothetical protein
VISLPTLCEPHQDLAAGTRRLWALLVILGDHAGSQRFGEVGMLPAERPEFREARPQTVFKRNRDLS